MKTRLTKILAAAAVLLTTLRALAVPVSTNDVGYAAHGWALENAAAFGELGNVVDVTAETDPDSGSVLWYVVRLEKGAAVVSPDTEIEPVIAVLPGSNGRIPAASPLRAMLLRDLRQRKAALASSAKLRTAAASQNASRWSKLVGCGKGTKMLTSSGNPATIVKLLDGWNRKSTETAGQTLRFWNQEGSSEYFSNSQVFNYYTPNHDACGCVATAGSAVMHYFRVGSGNVITRTCSVEGFYRDLTTKGGTYDWSLIDNVKLTYGSPVSLSTNARNLLAKVAYDCGVGCEMGYSMDGSGSSSYDLARSLADVFNVKNAQVVTWNGDDYGSGETISTSYYPDLIFNQIRAGAPVILGIDSHEVVATGYGIDSDGQDYTYVFMGWGGDDDAWYALPTVVTRATTDGDSYESTFIDELITEIAPSDGKYIAVVGRVTDSTGAGVSGETVTFSDGSKVTTDAKGYWGSRVAPEDGYVIIDGFQHSYTVGTAAQETSQEAKTAAILARDIPDAIDVVLGSVEPDPDRTLSKIAISGASEVTSGSRTTYTCTATYSDNSTETVTPTWSVSSGYATIDEDGVLTAGSVESATKVMLMASYTESPSTMIVSKMVTINPRDLTDGVTCYLGVAIDPIDLSSYAAQGTLTVTGLPTGLSYSSSAQTITGTATKAGSYTATITIKSGSTTDRISVPFTVTGIPVVVSSDTEDCTVSGSGSYAVGGTVKLTAKAASGYVFAGWYFYDAEQNILREIDGDNRSASCSVTLTEEMVDWTESDSPVAAFVATFMSAEEDADSLELEVDEYYDAGSDGYVEIPIYVYSFSSSKVTVTGLPTGLTFNSGTMTISGTVTTPGMYTVTVKVTNVSNTTGVTATCMITVPNIWCEEVPVDEEYVITGEQLDFSYILTDDGLGGTLTVTGLPKGMTYSSKTHVITGSPSAPGYYTVYFTRKIGKVSYVSTATFVVYGVDVIVEAMSYDDTGDGTATGSGLYAAGGTVTLKATPDKSSVFAGWYDQDGEPLATASDYRTAANTYTLTDIEVSDDNVECYIYGMFVSKDSDAESLMISMSESYYTDEWLDESGKVSIPVYVDSFSMPKVTVTGLPSGLSFNANTLMITGTPTAPGVYTVTVKATNTGNTKGVTGTFEIEVPNLYDELVPVEDSYVVMGDELYFDYILDDGEGGTLTVTGLPKGMTYSSKTYTITGSPSAPGKYTVTFTRKIGKVSHVSTATFIVYGVDVTVEAVSYDDTGAGTVSGTGLYAAGGKVTLKATADKSSVFAGWYDQDGEPLATVSDYRTAANTYTLSDIDVSEGDAVVDIFGMFVSKTTDAENLMISMSESYYTGEWLDDNGKVSIPVYVDSYSMPKVTVTGLPKGLSFNATTLLITGTPTVPGVYTVTVKATNTGNTKGVTGTFELTVPNLYDDLVPVEDSYVVTGDELYFDYILDDGEGGTLTVTGLPKGMTYSSKTYTITGSPSAPGKYTVTFTRKIGKVSHVSTATFIVYGVDVTVEATSYDDTGAGTVSGSGLYAVGGKVTLKATADKSSVFAGWYDQDDTPLATASDYRTAANTYVLSDLDVSEGDAEVYIYGAFVSKTTDAENLSISMAEYYYTGECLDESGKVSIPVYVDSYSMPKVTVTGLPSGLSFNANTLMITGTPTAPGVYTVTVKATNTGNTKGVTGTFEIEVPNLYDELVPVEDSYVVTGDELYFDYILDDGEGGTLTVTGLPKGMTYSSKTYTITGSPSAPGRYTVTFTRKIGKTSHVSTATFVVYGVDVTVEAVSGDDEGAGTVSGTGLYAAGGKVTLKATADKSSVFAGWYDQDGEPLATASDYRTAANTYVLSDLDVSEGDAEVYIYGAFVSKTTDAENLMISMSESYYTGEWLDDNGKVSIPVYVESYSMPKVTVTGLPKGLSFSATTLLITGTPTVPGVYTVTVKATNTGNTKGVTGTFEIEVPNLYDDLVPVEDSYVVTGNELYFDYILDDGEGGTLTVTGLPKGMTYSSKTYTITGSPSAPGRYTVTFTRKIGKTSHVSTATFVVYGVDVTVDTISGDDEGAGTVSGTGLYAAGGKVTLKATPDKSSVFAGWYDPDGEPLATASDYRTAANTYVLSDIDVSEGDAEVYIYGEFVSKDADADSLYIAMDEAYNTDEWLDEDGKVSIPVTVGSLSMPKVTVTGLPSGLSFNATTLMITGAVTTPGVYTVTVKATNTGNTKGESTTFELTVPNLYDDMVPVEDSYVVTGDYMYFGDLLEYGGTLKVTGLPSGMTYGALTGYDESGNKVSIDGYVYGTPKAAGKYTVTFTLTLDGEKYVSTSTFCVYAVQVSVTAGGLGNDTGAGTVKGGGSVLPGGTVTLSATPDKNSVFAGWYIVGGYCQAYTEKDYRAASNTLSVYLDDIDEEELENAVVEVTACFMSKEDDKSYFGLELAEEYDLTEQLSEYGYAYIPVTVESYSLPTVTVTGLPKGLSYYADSGMIVGYPTEPGTFTVTVTAKNSYNSVTQTTRIIVPNIDSGFFGDIIDHGTGYTLLVGDSEAVEYDLPCLSADCLGISATYTVSGLPTGISFKNGVWSGTPTKSGVYTVTLTTKYDGYTFTDTFTIEVISYMDAYVGTYLGTSDFTGFAGTWTLTVGSDGKATAKLNGNLTGSFSGTVTAEEGMAYGELSGKLGSYSGTIYVEIYAAEEGYHPTALLSLNVSSTSGMIYMDNSAYHMDSLTSAELSSLAGTKTVYWEGDENGGYFVGPGCLSDSGLSSFTMKIASSGAVTLSGKLAGMSLSGSATLYKGDGAYLGLSDVVQFSLYVKSGTKAYLLHLEFMPDDLTCYNGWYELISE